MAVKQAEVDQLRRTITARGERFSATLQGLHTAVREVASMAAQSQEELRHTSRQQGQLLGVLRDMTGPPLPSSVPQGDASKSSEDSSSSEIGAVHRPLRQYGAELRAALAGVVSKTRQGQQQLQSSEVRECRRVR